MRKKIIVIGSPSSRWLKRVIAELEAHPDEYELNFIDTADIAFRGADIDYVVLNEWRDDFWESASKGADQ